MMFARNQKAAVAFCLGVTVPAASLLAAGCGQLAPSSSKTSASGTSGSGGSVAVNAALAPPSGGGASSGEGSTNFACGRSPPKSSRLL